MISIIIKLFSIWHSICELGLYTCNLLNLAFIVLLYIFPKIYTTTYAYKFVRV